MEELKHLLQLDDGQWVLAPYRLSCAHHGVVETKFITENELEFYETFAQVHPEFSIDSVESLTYSADKLERLEKVQGMAFQHYDEIYDFVMHEEQRETSAVREFQAESILKRIREVEDALLEVADMADIGDTPKLAKLIQRQEKEDIPIIVQPPGKDRL